MGESQWPVSVTGDLFSIRLSCARIQGKSRRRLASQRPADNAVNPLVYIAALLPRQSSRDNANNGRGRTGVTHAPLNIVADKGAGDVLQTAIRHAPRPPPVKTFRTIAADAAAAVATSVCRDDGVSHVPACVLLRTALGNYEPLQFLGTRVCESALSCLAGISGEERGRYCVFRHVQRGESDRYFLRT